MLSTVSCFHASLHGRIFFWGMLVVYLGSIVLYIFLQTMSHVHSHFIKKFQNETRAEDILKVCQIIYKNTVKSSLLNLFEHHNHQPRSSIDINVAFDLEMFTVIEV